MSQNKILQGLINDSKQLVEDGRVRVATKFDCRVDTFIADKFKAYFVDSVDQTTGKKVTSTVLPDYDSDGNPICPEGAREVPTVMVVLSVLDAEDKPTGEVVRGFVLSTNVRALPAGISAIGLKALATGVEAMRKNGSRANTEGHFVSGLDFYQSNKAILACIAASRGGALFSGESKF